MKAPLLVVVHGHGQKIDKRKGLDFLTDVIKEQFPNIEVWEYVWNSNVKVAAKNIIINQDARPLIGIAYSWGNPWLKWLIDIVHKQTGVSFAQAYHVGPVNRQKGFPYSLRQVRAMLRIGGFITPEGVIEVHSFRQLNNRPAEKMVIPFDEHVTVYPQLTMGTRKKLNKLGGRAGIFSKKLYPYTEMIDETVTHATIDDHPVVHERILAKLIRFMKKNAR